MEYTPEIIIGIISFLGVIVVAVLNREFEHRLTSLESRLFTEAEKNQIKEMCIFSNIMWKSYERNLPQLLKNPPEADGLLERASLGIKYIKTTFTAEEKKTLMLYVEKQLKSDDGNRRFIAALYLDMLKDGDACAC